jgi:hypothetical protein
MGNTYCKIRSYLPDDYVFTRAVKANTDKSPQQYSIPLKSMSNPADDFITG